MVQRAYCPEIREYEPYPFVEGRTRVQGSNADFCVIFNKGEGVVKQLFISTFSLFFFLLRSSHLLFFTFRSTDQTSLRERNCCPLDLCRTCPRWCCTAHKPPRHMRIIAPSFEYQSRTEEETPTNKKPRATNRVGILNSPGSVAALKPKDGRTD